MPYLTPEDLPEERVCRALFIPDSADWLAIVSGALTELVKIYNWQQEGAVTVDDAVTAMQDMIDQFYEGCGDACVTPLGTPPFRLGEDGHIEQLVNNEWVTPTGEWAIPPTDPRDEPTAEERICMAAANAAYVLGLLYESLADSISEALGVVDAAAAFVATVAGGIGLLLGLITGGMIEMAGFVFAGVYAAVEWLTEDLWDEDFNTLLVCILVNCASEDGDVVHFDFDCVNEQLRAGTDLLDPTISQVRLLAQVSAMLGFLGAEGLDAAGATTALEIYDCEGCETCPGYADEMVSTLGAHTEIADSDAFNVYLKPTVPGSMGTYSSSGGFAMGQGAVTGVTVEGGSKRVVLLVELPDVCTFEGATIKWWHSAFGVSSNFIAVYDAEGTFLDYSQADSISAVDEWFDLDWTSGSVPDVKYVQFLADVTGDTDVKLGQLTVYQS